MCCLSHGCFCVWPIVDIRNIFRSRTRCFRDQGLHMWTNVSVWRGLHVYATPPPFTLR
jgi:hypothetical protein